MSAYTATPTITGTAYTEAASATGIYASSGRWSIYNPSPSTVVYASIDGVHDAAAIPPSQSWIVDAPEQSAQLWLRLGASGSVAVTCTLELGFDARTISSIGASYTSTDFDIPITTIGAYVHVAPAVGSTWTLDDDSNNVTLYSASTGAMLIGGVTTYRCLINGFMSLSKPGVTTAAEVALFVNGAKHWNGAECDVGIRSASLYLAPTFHVLSPGDIIDLRVANMENDNDFTCHAASLVVVPVGVA